MKTKALLVSCLGIIAGTVLFAQTQAPLVVQAVVPAATPVPAPAAPAPAISTDATLKMLQEMKAANDEILSKQAAALKQLEELEKAAEQIKIYTKRG